MIPATSFLLDGDTALVVEYDRPGVLGGWCDHNRTCDTCGGTGWRSDHSTGCDRACGGKCGGTGIQECGCIDGRHTFTIEVEAYEVQPIGLARPKPATLTVHVIDVLPIYGQPDSPLPAGTGKWVWHSPDDADPDRRGTFLCEIAGSETVMTPIALPPDAAPGKWLVRVKVHQ